MARTPYVTVPVAPVSFPQSYYVDPTTFEAGVRDLVNSEFVTRHEPSFHRRMFVPDIIYISQRFINHDHGILLSELPEG